VQETRGWDENKNITVSQRKKESAHDYRYFPEPDIPPFEFTSEYVEKLRLTLPELPDAKLKRFVLEYGLPEKDAVILTEERQFSEYFEAVVSELTEKVQGKEVSAPLERTVKLACNYLLTELRKHLVENNQSIEAVPITAENFAEFIGIVADGKINSSAAQTVLGEMYRGSDGDTDPSHIIDRLNLGQVNDSEALEKAVDAVLERNEQSVADFKAGKQNALQYLMGQVMSETKGKANPQMVMELLRKKLA
jgi:aspartyl-tRNA(Asn)/glutamyl-tRNA(Gln) amidotransferase subunit B